MLIHLCLRGEGGTSLLLPVVASVATVGGGLVRTEQVMRVLVIHLSSDIHVVR